MASAAPSSDAVELRIGGRVYGGWKEITIEVDLDAGASSFALEVTERWQGQPDRWAIEAGAAAVVTIGGEPVTTGFVDKLGSKLDKAEHRISVSGRSRTGDLIDCSAVVSGGSWKNRKLEQIAAELAEPFGLAVVTRADTGKAFHAFAINQGEAVWAAIQRLCSHRALLPVTNAAGDVEIISPARTGAAVSIVEGVHPLSIEGRHDVSERHSIYIVKGQRSGDNQTHGRAAASPHAEARDPAVTRYRPLIIVAEDQADATTAKRRAEFEATLRAAKSQDATIELPLWRRADGVLWWPQAAVDLDAPSAWMQGELMVAGVKFSSGAQGRSVELRLVRPEAYSQRAVPEEAEASRVRRHAGRRRRGGSGDAATPRPNPRSGR